MQLVWFRNDLRRYDHAGLTHALESSEPVIAVFISTEGQWQQQDMAEIKRNLIYARLANLSEQLAQLNTPLIFKAVDHYDDSITQLLTLCQQYKITQVHACIDYELNEQIRDKQAAEALNSVGIQFNQYHDSVVFKPGSITKADGSAYRVFSAFKKSWLKQFMQLMPVCYAKPKAQQTNWAEIAPELVSTTDSNATQSALINQNTTKLLTQLSKSSSNRISHLLAEHCERDWPSDEDMILNRLRTFCREQVHLYETQRDLPAIEGTSRLSAYLSIGSISPRQAINRLLAEQGEMAFSEVFSTGKTGAATWLSELIWREFYRHLVSIYPDISKGLSVKPQYQHLNWRNNPVEFKAWCDGVTGFPIVDAAMRQLNQTGWMHNRLRMITASFLIKDLQIDWRWGERYFMQHLIDGDYAANNGGWQWCASTGHDAAPYFRVFNPTTQSERFDKEGLFIRRYCPELADVPDKYIHQPHIYADKFKQKLGYPKPIVEHKQAREVTLQMYRKAN